jgi:hypothetical protein
MLCRAFLAALLLVLPASGSLVENSTGASYQFDAGTDHDAPDTCAALASASHPFLVARDGETRGFLLPPDDAADHFRLRFAPADVGTRFSVSVLKAEAGADLQIDVLLPDCASNILAPQNQPFPAHNPPAPAAGEQQASPHNLPNPGGNGNCQPSGYEFLITQIATPPASIRVTWTNGAQQDVPLQSANSNTARYGTTDHAAYTLHAVTANLPQSWTGQFNVNKRPCGAADGGAVFGPPNTMGPTGATFTPTMTGDYVLKVALRDPKVPTSIPLTCHTACKPIAAPAVDSISYTALHSLW